MHIDPIDAERIKSDNTIDTTIAGSPQSLTGVIDAFAVAHCHEVLNQKLLEVPAPAHLDQ